VGRGIKDLRQSGKKNIGVETEWEDDFMFIGRNKKNQNSELC
jgi:hypothetical protein